eukprot:CAMPEP_0194228206 /NCGR_PEP_ID=MMETSP0156-20130528/43253_1 /TAXON_ID=33649 /ORGANISM="Thalassionema nitzschioides, Strain L26-B" /LENGTH=169 /DNA_ID=CAMNT_0038960713 /DNA_START=186 /DNA_END=695 /DNA_ORIENTATION=-
MANNTFRKQKRLGRPVPQSKCQRPFTCPIANCGLSYGSSAGLYQHKRNVHPETIQTRGSQDREALRKFVCPVEGCYKSYDASAGLYQHKRIKHPELIANCSDLSYGSSAELYQHKRNVHPEIIQARGSRGSGALRKFVCPAEGCYKSYDASAGLYQHKRSKHPELIKRR